MYILNLACKRTCYYSSQNCVQIESNTIDNSNVAIELDLANVKSDIGKEEAIKKVVSSIRENGVKTYIPSLTVSIPKKILNPWGMMIYALTMIMK